MAKQPRIARGTETLMEGGSVEMLLQNYARVTELLRVAEPKPVPTPAKTPTPAPSATNTIRN